jgi:cytidine deaminase
MSSEAVEGGLRALASEAMAGAYAPYSGFRVGAALEAADGRRFTGCNIENASYSVTACAERVALGNAVAHGARRFSRIAIAAQGESPVAPCGVCRQALAEFGIDLEVISVNPNGVETRWSLGELLPSHFSLDAGPKGPGAE